MKKNLGSSGLQNKHLGQRSSTISSASGSEGPYSLGSGDSRPSRAEAADLVKGVLSLGRLGGDLEVVSSNMAGKGGNPM